MFIKFRYWSDQQLLDVWMRSTRKLQRQCGTYAVACMLRNRGYSLNEALACLAKRGRRV